MFGTISAARSCDQVRYICYLFGVRQRHRAGYRKGLCVASTRIPTSGHTAVLMETQYWERRLSSHLIANRKLTHVRRWQPYSKCDQTNEGLSQWDVFQGKIFARGWLFAGTEGTSDMCNADVYGIQSGGRSDIRDDSTIYRRGALLLGTGIFTKTNNW